MSGLLGVPGHSYVVPRQRLRRVGFRSFIFFSLLCFLFVYVYASGIHLFNSICIYIYTHICVHGVDDILKQKLHTIDFLIFFLYQYFGVETFGDLTEAPHCPDHLVRSIGRLFLNRFTRLKFRLLKSVYGLNCSF